MYISPTNPMLPRIFYSGIYKKWTVNIFRRRLGGKYSLWVKAYQHTLKLNRILDAKASRQAMRDSVCPQDSGKASLPTTPSRTLSPELAEHVEQVEQLVLSPINLIQPSWWSDVEARSIQL